jgi:ribose 5-phosphate isomerase B
LIALASDHVGLVLKKEIITMLNEMNLEYNDFGTNKTKRTDYALFGYPAALAVASGECEKGILFCGTGIGISLSANKVKGIRCAVCSDCYSAVLSRQHNNANMLALGARVVGADLARMIVRMWLEAVFEGGRHQIRLDQISQIESGKVDFFKRSHKVK